MTKKVLVVDDSATDIEIVRAFLSEEDVEILTATDGLEAIQVLEQSSVDLVVMDMIMPNQDGWETTKQIRAEEKWSNIPVVGVSTAQSNFDVEKAKLNGVQAYFSKPLNRLEFLEYVRTLL